MPICEKCWGEAYARSYCTGKSQAECYQEILKEKDDAGMPCTEEEQRGYRDEEDNESAQRI